jgi:nucleotide-binding universal stress UspA family protein
MTEYHVILPVEHRKQVDGRYGVVLSFLEAREATIHLVSVNEQAPKIYDETAHLQTQQEQINKLTSYLKFEMLDGLAQDIEKQYPLLRFEYHVDIEPLPRVVSNIKDEFNAQFLLVDHDCLQKQKEDSYASTLQYLVTMTELPIWCVGDGQSEGDEVVIGVDLPAQNPQLDSLNRVLISAGANLAKQFESEAHIVHSWQLSSEQFLRQWLQLSDIDVARYSRVERQQREAQVIEYIDECDAKDTRFNIMVVEGSPEITLPNMCERKQAKLLVIGHNQNQYGPMGHITASTLETVKCDVLVLPQSVKAHIPFQSKDAYYQQPTGEHNWPTKTY